MDFSTLISITLPARYLDPGTGSTIVQIVLATILGLGVTLKLFWARIKGGARKNGSAGSDAEREDEDN